jgi:hypothetical protein
VNVPYWRIETYAERPIESDVVVHTDSGDFVGIFFTLVDGNTFQVDSAGVNYAVLGHGLYSATVPLSQAYELRTLSSVERVHFADVVHQNQLPYARRPSQFGSMRLTMNPPLGAASLDSPAETFAEIPIENKYAIIHTDSGEFIHIGFKMTEGATLSQIDSAGVNYYEWGDGWYAAYVPVSQAYELRALSSIERVRFGERMHQNQLPYGQSPSQFGSIELTMNPPPGTGSPSYTLRIFSTLRRDSVMDTTNQVYGQEYETADLERGVIVDSLATGYHQCHLTSSLESSVDGSGLGSETAVNLPCSDIYIFGIIVSEGYITPVSVPDSLFDTHAADTGRSRSACVIHWRLQPGENYILKQ